MLKYDVFLQYAVPELVERAFIANGGSTFPRNEIDVTAQIREIQDLTELYNPFGPSEYVLPESLTSLYSGVGMSSYVPIYILRANFQNSP